MIGVPGMDALRDEIRPVEDQLGRLRKELQFLRGEASGRIGAVGFSPGERQVAEARIKAVQAAIYAGEKMVRDQEQRMVQLAEQYARA